MLMLNEIGIVFRVIQFENTEKSGKKVDLFYVQTFFVVVAPTTSSSTNGWKLTRTNKKKTILKTSRTLAK